MAVLDDLRRLAAEDIVYHSYSLSENSGVAGPTVFWYRGRLRQASDGSWVFQTFTGGEGAYGITMGGVGSNWSSSESPSSGLVITITNSFSQNFNILGSPLTFPLFENITISQTPATSLQS
jgi:hypothetical protein